MKLHKGNLFWPANTEDISLEIHNNFETNKDVLVVGSGMSGALSAYELSKAGYKVTMIEENRIASGSSSANTGLIQYMSDQGVKKFAEQIGKDAAIRFYNQSKDAVDHLIKINDELVDIDQENFIQENFIQENSIILATEMKKTSDVKEETKMQKEIGYDVKYINYDQLADYNLKAYGGLLCGPDINLNPYAFVLRLLKTAVDNYNLEIVEGVKFIKCEKINDENIVSLEIGGQEINKSYRKIVIATGYNPPDQFKKNLKNIEIYKTYVSVTNKVEDKGYEDLLVWEVKDAYTYFKKTFDNRLMIGGFDEKSDTIKDKDVGKRDKGLEKGANSMLVEKYNIETNYSYTALFGISKDNLPYMGIDPENDDIFVICGVGGNGTVYSKIGATMATMWIKGDSLEEYETYRLGR